jgi:hypothetical protein
MLRVKNITARCKSSVYLRILQFIGVCGAGFFMACKYGSPVPDYGVRVDDINFHGNIKSEDSLKNIPGLTVRLVNTGSWGDSLETHTNNSGEYSIQHAAMEGDQFKLKVFDTDSTANEGNFKNKTVPVEISGRDVNNLEHQTDVLMEKK